MFDISVASNPIFCSVQQVEVNTSYDINELRFFMSCGCTLSLLSIHITQKVNSCGNC